MVTETESPSPATKLTPKGERTRSRIVAAAAELMFERGVADTTTEDVKEAAQVSGSQLYHYFADKDALVQAVIAQHADAIVANQQQVRLDSLDGLRAWRDMIVTHVRRLHCRGGCPLGALVAQVAETDPLARAGAAAGFNRWEAAMREGLRTMQTSGQLSADADPDDLAVALLAALQGGLLLAQAQRDPKPLETALDATLTLIGFLTVTPRRTPAKARR